RRLLARALRGRVDLSLRGQPRRARVALPARSGALPRRARLRAFVAALPEARRAPGRVSGRWHLSRAAAPARSKRDARADRGAGVAPRAHGGRARPAAGAEPVDMSI